MERRSFVRRLAGYALGAGIASGVASGAADLMVARARDDGSRGSEVEVVEGIVRKLRMRGYARDGQDAELTVVLEQDDDTRIVRFIHIGQERFEGPEFDLERLASRLERDRSARIVVVRREDPTPDRGLAVLPIP